MRSYNNIDNKKKHIIKAIEKSNLNAYETTPKPVLYV